MQRNIKNIAILITIVLAIFVSTAWGDIRPNNSDEVIYITENRTLLESHYSDSITCLLVDSASNYIIDSGQTLLPMMEKMLALRSGEDSVLSILHIGDSHIQAGFWTMKTRELLQKEFGNAGRGLIVPYKLAGGNEPTNYAIQTPHKVNTLRAVSKSNGEELGMTGVAVTFREPEVDFEIWSKNPFNAITVFHSAKAPMLKVSSDLVFDTYCPIDNRETSTRIVLPKVVDTLQLKGRISMEYNDPTFYGFSLENGGPGVIYHGVGSNSAAFEHIRTNTTIIDGGAEALHPDLVVISLGTNNCYGRNYRSSSFYTVANSFVKRLKESYPSAAIMLTTPMESCHRVGGSRVPNSNIADVARVLKEVAHENGVACWDMYSAAGGGGANASWSKKGLFSRDKIHLTEKGYELQGEMMYEAIARYYNNFIVHGSGNPLPIDSLVIENDTIEVN